MDHKQYLELVGKLLKASASKDFVERYRAQTMLSEVIAATMDQPIRQGNLVGDNHSDLFKTEDLGPNAIAQYELDPLGPGQGHDLKAYQVSQQGYIPEATVQSDYIIINTYRTANAIDWPLTYAEHSRVTEVERLLAIFNAGFVHKMNDDAWHLIVMAGADRNVLVYDADAANGQFTKRLVSLGKTVMKRNGGGNANSLRRTKLTDVYCSPECSEDMRNWGLAEVDEVTRREIYVMDDETVPKVMGVYIHEMYELGNGQAYQNFYSNTLGGALPSGDNELLIGVNRNTNSFVKPVRKGVEVFPRVELHSSQRQGYYGWTDAGFGQLDNRDVVLMAC